MDRDDFPPDLPFTDADGFWLCVLTAGCVVLAVVIGLHFA